MGQVVGILGAVGGFLSTYGSAIVSAVSVAASLAMSFIPRPGVSIEGPRLADTSVMTSTYGIPIPRVIGRCRLAGNLIWATDIEEVKTTKKIGGKGSMFGGTSAKQTTYSYYGNFAVAFSKGSGSGCFAKVYADKKLIYDATGASEAFLKYPEAALRFYTGGASQQPDPLIEADQGAGNVSAHRDLVYIVVENLPLLDFGNRLPQIEAEFDSSAAAQYNRDDTTSTVSFLPDWYQQSVRYDPTTRQMYGVQAPFFGGPGLYASVFRLDMSQNSINAKEESTPPGPPYLWESIVGDGYGFRCEGVFPYTDGKVILTGGVAAGHALAKVNPYTLKPTYINTYWTTGGLGNFQERASCSLTRYHPSGISNYIVFAHASPTAPTSFTSALLVWDRDEEVLSATTKIGGAGHQVNAISLEAACVDRDGIMWLLGADYSQAAGAAGNRADLVRIEINRTINVPGLGDSAEIKTEIIRLTDTGLDGNLGSIAYDPSSHSLFMGTATLDSNNQHKWILWDIATRTVTASRTFDEDLSADYGYRIAQANAESTFNQTGVVGGEIVAWCYGGGGGSRTMRRIRMADLTDKVLASPDPAADLPRHIWDPTQNQSWFMTGGTPSSTTPQLVQWDRCTETPVPLEDVITELVELSRELGASDIDVTDSGILAQDLRGLLIGRQMPVRRALESLIFPFQLDVVESDGVLKFTTRGGASARTISEDDLGAQTQGAAENKLVIDRSQEAEVPFRMDLRYYDWDRDFLEGNQSALRHLAPFPTQYSPEVAQISVPVVMSAGEAAKAVETGLYNAWVARTGYQLALGPKHMDLDPADVITVERGLDSFLMRIVEWQLEDGFTSVLAAASEDDEVYSSTAVGESVTVPTQSFGPPGATELFVMDIPLLRDMDDTNQLGTGVYIAFGRHQSNWRGSIAERSTNGGARWDRFSTSRDSAPWGYLDSDVAALSMEPDDTYPQEILRLDETTQITVQIVADGADLEEITRTELWTNQENGMLIGEGDSAEIIRFQNFTDNGDGTYTFSNLLRGRRGTEEQAIAGHTEGDRVVFLSEEAVNREGIDLGRVSRTDFYRAASIGEFVEAAVIRAVDLQGNDIKPYTVCRPEASAASGSPRAPWTITWTRRTRAGGNMDLQDGIQQDEVPVGEESESYEVAVLHKTGGNEVATLTATDDATGVTITSTEHTAGGYTDGDPVDVIIYQMSAVVGRGRPLAVTL